MSEWTEGRRSVKQTECQWTAVGNVESRGSKGEGAGDQTITKAKSFVLDETF